MSENIVIQNNNDIMPSRKISKDVMNFIPKIFSDEERQKAQDIKELRNDLYELIDNLTSSRETSIAKTKLEECIMWAIKSI